MSATHVSGASQSRANARSHAQIKGASRTNRCAVRICGSGALLARISAIDRRKPGGVAKNAIEQGRVKARSMLVMRTDRRISCVLRSKRGNLVKRATAMVEVSRALLVHVERKFAAFAKIPYHDATARRELELLLDESDY